MQLQYKSTYLSINSFEPVEIPRFVVLTGVNGSGKSHLLQAINNKHVVIAGLEKPQIVLFNYETFKLENESAFNAHQLASEKESAWNFHTQNIRQHALQWRTSIGDYDTLKSTCAVEKKSFWGLPVDTVKGYRQQFTQFFQKNNFKGNNQAQGIYSLAKRLPYSIDEIPHDDFVRLYKPFEFKNDFLPHQLGKIFWDYYVKYRENQVNEFQNSRYGKEYQAVSEEEFLQLHGEKPWELVNKILASFDSLKYRVTSPEGSDYFGSYQLRLQHTEKPEVQVDFGHLSSGERILMALVASIYKSSTDRFFPDVLLLDEVDASLHPSMMKNMLDVIQEIFVREGVNVILISHSPTTIALAPEESIFIMNRSGPQRVAKKPKREALEILTEGYVTLEEGLKIFDEIARSGLTILTEGHNACLIKKALELSGVSDVEVLTGVEGVSGKNQLKTIFQFIAKTSHRNKVLFVWDCDVTNGLQSENRTYPFFIPFNAQNQLVKKGIENAFPEQLFEDFTTTITRSDKTVISAFDESRKRDFANFIISRNNQNDFQHFSSLIEEIRRVREVN